MSFFSASRKTDYEKYFKSLNQIENNQEYQCNQKQINFIIKTLVEDTDVPREILEMLIEYVQENVAIEYELYSKY